MAKNEKPDKPITGCDIGNAFGYASIARGMNDDPLPLMPDALGASGMPTDAFVAPPEGKEIRVYPPDKVGMRKHPELMLRTIKRRLQDRALSLEGVAQPVPVDAVYSAIARDLMKAANEVAVSSGRQPSYDLVFTFPVAFKDDLDLLNRMEASINAVELDGRRLHVVGRLPEPAAAALDYLHFRQYRAEEGRRITQQQLTVLVYDLGHGTFDTALVTVRSKGEPYRVLSKDGIRELGGVDFDEMICDELQSQLQRTYHYTLRNQNEREKLRALAQEAKHALSDPQMPEARVPFTIYRDGDAEEVELSISLSRFEELGLGRVNETVELVQKLLAEAERKGCKADAIVLTGGASRMRMVRRALEEAFPEYKDKIELFRPSTAVSFGAALYGASLAAEAAASAQPAPSAPDPSAGGQAKPAVRPRPILEQYTDTDYGVWLPGGDRRQGQVRVLIPRGEKLPARSAQPLRLSGAAGLEIRVESTLEPAAGQAVPVEGCREIARLRFGDFPADAVCELFMEVGEDYNVTLRCITPNGRELRSGTGERG